MSAPHGGPPAGGAAVWVLLGRKEGDNAQVTALAEAVGRPFAPKRLAHRRTELVTNLLLRVTRAGLVRSASDPLAPPWPRLVITAGRRNEPVARWIRRRSGGRTRLVHVGRPWAHPRRFDLVVTTPQYRLPSGPGVLVNDLPLHRVTPERLRAARRRFEDRLAHLPRPRVAVLLGGHSGALVMPPRLVRQLAARASALVAPAGGSLLVTTSARTPAGALEVFRDACGVPWHGFDWASRGTEENPYEAYLALADAFVVTADSVSMLAEACATGRPLHVFDTRGGGGRPWWLTGAGWRWRPLTHRLGQVVGPRRLRRDAGAVTRRLLATGRAHRLGEAPLDAPVAPGAGEDLERAAARVRELIGEPG